MGAASVFAISLLIVLMATVVVTIVWLHHRQTLYTKAATDVYARVDELDSTVRGKIAQTNNYVLGVEKRVTTSAGQLSTQLANLDDRAMGMAQGAKTQMATMSTKFAGDVQDTKDESSKGTDALQSSVEKTFKEAHDALQGNINKVDGALRADLNSLRTQAKTDFDTAMAPRDKATVRNLSTNMADFGYEAAGRQADAGKIMYQKWSVDALDVVGAGKPNQSRKVKVWDELSTDKVVTKNAFAAALSSDSTTTKALDMQGPIRMSHNMSHPDNIDGAIYRADGQLQIASDEMVRMRDIATKQTGIQFDVTQSSASINTPDGTMKIGRQGIMFGGPNKGREVNSAQISAGKHVPNSLNIVGMSSGTSSADRRVDMFAEGGLHNHGPLYVGLTHIGSADGNTYIRPGKKDGQLALGLETSKTNIHGAETIYPRKNHDWLRIHGATNGTAMYNGVAINHQGGLAVGSWTKPPQGNIDATGDVNAARLCTGDICLRADGTDVVVESKDKTKTLARMSQWATKPAA